MKRLRGQTFGSLVTRPNIWFVAIKNAEQQAILSLHRARQGFVKASKADDELYGELIANALLQNATANASRRIYSQLE